MAHAGRTLPNLRDEIDRRARAKRDFIAPMARVAVGTAEGSLLMTLEGTEDPFPVGEIAHAQLAEYTGVPLAYYRRMLRDKPALLAQNVNTWLADTPADRRMVRTLDGNVRAFLSDRFRPLENEDLADAVLPVMEHLNLMLISCEITERRLYLKAVDRSIERDIPKGRQMGDGVHEFFDTVSPAIVISNSEVGHGSLSVETSIWTRACTNLATLGASLRKYHVGGRAATSDDVYALLSDRTKQATDAAVWLQVRDLVKAAFDAARFEANVRKLADATRDTVEPDAVIEVVNRSARRFAWSEGERAGILGRLIGGGDLSRYGLHSAVTLHSQSDTLDYDRATELERMGGDIIEMPAPEWRQLVAA